jgi:hypothetical protein
MEEIFAILLGVITEGDLVPATALVVSEELLTEVAVEEAVLSDVYSGVVETLEVFKTWASAAFAMTSAVVNAMLGLQLLYNMILTHYDQASQNGFCVSIEVALEDIEGTFKANYQKMIALANKEIADPQFASLPDDVQAEVRGILAQTPMQYWLAQKITIMKALMKVPMYAS